jgi:hypothetical protein
VVQRILVVAEAERDVLLEILLVVTAAQASSSSLQQQVHSLRLRQEQTHSLNQVATTFGSSLQAEHGHQL